MGSCFIPPSSSQPSDPLSPLELPLEVLNTMRCYVKHFFGCQECAQHFEAMAAKSMDQVKSRREAVLWLWSHHNEVNARLAGTGLGTGIAGAALWYPGGAGSRAAEWFLKGGVLRPSGHPLSWSVGQQLLQGEGTHGSGDIP